VAVVDEWADKAEADYKAAVALNRRRREPLPDIVCYHCQQCAEKYLKAYLIAQGVAPPHIHDLVQLLNLAGLHDATFAARRPLTQALNPYGVMFRYPGMSASEAEARDAVRTVRRLRTFLRRKMGL
jgi:HEPN domain-containing protein